MNKIEATTAGYKMTVLSKTGKDVTVTAPNIEVLLVRAEKARQENDRLTEFMDAFEEANRKYNEKMFANITYE